MVATEDLELYVFEVTLRTGNILTLSDAMHVIDNAALPNSLNI
jgi:hypothetical protein